MPHWCQLSKSAGLFRSCNSAVEFAPLLASLCALSKSRLSRMYTFGICQVPQPPDISIAHFESSCADVQDTITTHLRGTGEGNDAAQIALRAIFTGDGVWTIRTVLEVEYSH